MKRAPSFGAKQRSRLARRAATARWARLGRGVLTLAQIQEAVTKALAEHGAKAAAGGAGVPRRSFFKPPAPGEREMEAPDWRKPEAYLFDSYARGDATARDEIYILVIVKKMPYDWPVETTDLTSAIGDALGDDAKEIILYLSDRATFNEWKGAYGTPYFAVATEGIRLV
jgi:hypothetical protein